MDDAAFKQDRLQEASAKLTERVEALKALEADRRMWAEHERVESERNRLAEAMQRFSRSDCADRSPCSSDRSLRPRDRATQRNIDCEVRPYPPRVVGSGARYHGPVSGRRSLGRLHCGRGAAIGSSCFWRGRREGQAARRAIRQFASGGLAEAETGRGTIIRDVRPQALGVNFQEVVHSVPTGGAEVC
jgi:hypothetical protein